MLNWNVFFLAREALAKRSQHFNATYRNIVGCNMLCVFGHPVVTYWNLLGVVGSSSKTVKLFMQHSWILRFAWCCTHLVRFVQQCCARARALVRFLTPNISQHVANRVAKRAQHVAPNNVAICCLQVSRSLGRSLNCKCWANNVGICCVEMLRSFGWGLKQY